MSLNLDSARQIKGWMSDPELEWLARTAKGKKLIVEFGSYLGRSTRALCDNTDGLVIAVDPWDGVYYNNDGQPINILKQGAYELFRINVNDHLESGKLEAIRCRSTEFPTVSTGRVDFLFIDADHRYEAVKQDIDIARKLVKPNGIIAGHDYGRSDWPGVQQAVDEIYPNCQKCDTIWWTTNQK